MGLALPSPAEGMTTNCTYGDYETAKCTKVPHEDILVIRSKAIAHAVEGEAAIKRKYPETSKKYQSGVAHIPLVVTKQMIDDYIADKTIEECDENNCPDNYQCIQATKAELDVYLKNQKFCLKSNRETSTEETSTEETSTEELEVHWLSRKSGETTIHILYVWGYSDGKGGKAPVTGDYDMWLGKCAFFCFFFR